MIPDIEIKPMLSRQGEILTEPRKAQVHFLRPFQQDDAFFALVVNVDGDFCDVIPGCFDAMQAGQDDIFLPEEILGEAVMLSVGSICTVRREAIGEGFATLDDESYNNIISAVIKYNDDVDDLGFDRGYKYLSANDPRIEVHHRMLDRFIAAQEIEPIVIAWQEYSAAAAPRHREHLLKCMVESRDGTTGRLVMIVKEEGKMADAVMLKDDNEPSEEYDGSFLVDKATGLELGRFKCGRTSFAVYNGMSVLFCSSRDNGGPLATKRCK